MKLKIAENVVSAPINTNSKHQQQQNANMINKIDMSELIIVGGSNSTNINSNLTYSVGTSMSNTFFDKLFLDNRNEHNTSPQSFSTKHRLSFNNSTTSNNKPIKNEPNSTSSSRQHQRHPNNVKMKTVAERTNILSHNLNNSSSSNTNNSNNNSTTNNRNVPATSTTTKTSTVSSTN